MVKIVLFLFFLILGFSGFSQNRNYSEWINFGSSHAAKWLQIAPGQLGPNALLVPPMDYATIGSESALEIGSHYHQMTGDTAVNSFFRYYWNVAPERVAIEIWGQPSETFRLSNELRDERQIYYDDEGWMTQVGDLLISTHVQLVRNHRFLPDATLNYTMKTTTGENEHGRYTDAEMNYFYLAMGHDINVHTKLLEKVRLAALLGFYVWQTNKVEMAQDEGPLFEFGIQLSNKNFNLFSEFGGYSAYGSYKYMNVYLGEGAVKQHNDPLIWRNRIEKTGDAFNFTFEYMTGFRDYHYQTFKLGVVYHFQVPERKFSR